MRAVPKINQIQDQKSQISNSKITALQKLLVANRSSRKKLNNILTQVKNRLNELQEAGAQNSKNSNNYSVKKELLTSNFRKPQTLIDQLYIRQTPYKQISFARDIAKKLPRSQEIDIKKLSKDVRGIDFTKHYQKFVDQSKNPIEAYRKWRELYRKKQLQLNDKRKKDVGLQQIQKVQLRKRKALYGQNWEKLGFYYNGLQFSQIYTLYHEELCNRDMGKWSLRHNIMMIVLVQYYGKGKWAAVSRLIKIKSQFQCRERFCNILDPAITQNYWSQDDEKTLLQVAKQYNYKWSAITKNVERFSNKTDNALRRKFRNLVMKFDNQKIDKIVEKKALALSIKDFKKNYYNRSKKSKQKQSIQKSEDQIQ